MSEIRWLPLESNPEASYDWPQCFTMHTCCWNSYCPGAWSFCM